MNDALAERFAALVDTRDDSDWLDVRRRARRSKRLVLPSALVAAAALAAAAVAASGSWIFSSHARDVTAMTRVAVGGRSYRVSITTTGARRICLGIAVPNKPPDWDRYCTVVGDKLTLKSPSATPLTLLVPGPPFRAIQLAVPGGEIIAGASIGFARRIKLTDVRGHVYSTQTISSPRGTKTPFRYWAIGVGPTKIREIAAYDARGRTIRRPLP